MVALFWRLIYQFRNNVPKWMILQIWSQIIFRSFKVYIIIKIISLKVILYGVLDSATGLFWAEWEPKAQRHLKCYILDFYSFYKSESFSRVGVNRLALTQLLKKIVLEWNNFSMSISNICKRNVHFCKTDLLGESNRKRVLEVLENIKAVLN